MIVSTLPRRCQHVNHRACIRHINTPVVWGPCSFDNPNKLYTLVYIVHIIYTILHIMSDYKFEGWVGLDKSAAEGQMVWQEFEPKAWEETDVDIKVSCCGICGSDLHTLRSGWVSIPAGVIY